LAIKLRPVLMELVKPHLTDKWRIIVPISASGIIIPDPTEEGILGEDELYFGTPDLPRDTQDGHHPEYLEGDILVMSEVPTSLSASVSELGRPCAMQREAN
jgi:hypothetical protein